MTRPAVAHCGQCEGRGFVVATTPSPAQLEHARLLNEARAMVARHVDLGRARDADRWRAFARWLKATPPPQ
jgi:hypothetical protein